MSGATTGRIRALLPIEADQVRIEPGTVADIRIELVDALVEAGAAEEVADDVAVTKRGKQA